MEESLKYRFRIIDIFCPAAETGETVVDAFGGPVMIKPVLCMHIKKEAPGFFREPFFSGFQLQVGFLGEVIQGAFFKFIGIIGQEMIVDNIHKASGI